MSDEVGEARLGLAATAPRVGAVLDLAGLSPRYGNAPVRPVNASAFLPESEFAPTISLRITTFVVG